MCRDDVGIHVLRQDRVFWFGLLFVLLKKEIYFLEKKVVLELVGFWTEKVKLA